MRRFVGLLFLVFFALPLGLSVAGCGHGATVQYCNGSGYGPTTGQVAHITLASNLSVTGESLNYGQIGTPLAATAEDCNGNSVSVSSFTYASSDMTVADVNPTNGTVCAGTWNRNTGGGIANYTVCTAPANPTNHSAFITASANGATSNPIEVYIHPIVTGVVLGNASTDCTNDPATNCSACIPNSSGTSIPSNIPVYDENSCYSQNQSALLVARIYANNSTSSVNNITCQVGPLTFALQGTANIASIAANGVVTFNQPGSSLVTTTVSNSSSALNAGFVSTCPPASIVLTAVNNTPVNGKINVAVNTPQAFTATVLDTNKTAANNFQGNPITGLALEFNSTLPVNFPATSSTVTAVYPGTATITAACVPPTCNPAPFSQIGFLGNGQPLTSNGIQVTAPGTVSDVLYMASTSSDYLASENFVTGQPGSPVKLPYSPNSLVISQDGSTIYMGSAGGLMVVNTGSGAVTATYQAVQGSVLAVAPNNSYAVVTDAVRQTVSLVTSSGSVYSSFNGVGTRAEWTPDSTTLYVTTNSNQLLTYSTFIGWESTTINTESMNPAVPSYTDVAITVPNYGAYFAGKVTDGRSSCASTSENTSTVPTTTTNIFTPLVTEVPVITDRLTATNDGNHMIGATASTTPATLEDLDVTPPTQVTPSGAATIAACPQPPVTLSNFFSAGANAHQLPGVSATSINGIPAAGNSAVAAVTYSGTGGVLPLYAPASGTVTNVTLSNGATAPVAGVFSTDNTTFYTGTSGDNAVHVIKLNGATGTDSGTLTPSLPGLTGGTAAPNLMAIRSIRTTS